MMRNAIQRHSTPDTTVPTLSPAEQNRKLTIRIHRELDAIGISPKAIGYEYLTRNFTAVINYKRGVPTLTEFIYHYANRFRNEL